MGEEACDKKMLIRVAPEWSWKYQKIMITNDNFLSGAILSIRKVFINICCDRDKDSPEKWIKISKARRWIAEIAQNPELLLRSKQVLIKIRTKWRGICLAQGEAQLTSEQVL